MAKAFFRRFTKKFFIICNIIVALLFLLGCYGYWFNPVYFWPLGFITIAVFYLLLVLLGFIFFWLFLKPKWSLISLITILLAYKPVTNVIPLRFSSSFNLKKDSNDLRVMSWNVAQFDVLNLKKTTAIKDGMIDLVNQYQPDIACFQEMVAEDSTVTKHLHINEFIQRLGFNNYFYSYNVKEDFWDGAHFGLVIFSKYPIVNRQTIMWYPNDYNSIIQYVDVVKNTDTIRVFNLHLQSLKFTKPDLEYLEKPELEDKNTIKQSRRIAGKFKVGFLKRMVQAERIKAEINKSPYKVIVCGDFNDVPNSYAYNKIGNNLKNAFVEKGNGLGRTFSGISPTLRIDNIFTDKKIAINQFTRVNKKLSDHFPILADVIIKK